MAQVFSNERAARQRNHDEYTGGNMARFRSTAWDREMRSEVVAVPCNVRMIAKYNGRCVECDGQIKAGETIEYNPTARKAMHVECPRKEVTVDTAAQADALLNEYDQIKQSNQMSARSQMPVGNYTIRPADEKQAAVLSFGPATFGHFPEGTVKVAMHGSFVVTIDGLSQSRSWYGFCTVKPGGRVDVYRNALAILSTPDADLRPEDVHLKAKLLVALKAVHLFVKSDIDSVIGYGQAYVAGESKCFRCDRPLKDEKIQIQGIGNVCLSKLRETFGGR